MFILCALDVYKWFSTLGQSNEIIFIDGPIFGGWSYFFKKGYVNKQSSILEIKVMANVNS